MKKLKKTTIWVLMATLVFSNMQLGSIYGYETGDIGENVNTHIVPDNDINIKSKNIKEHDKKEIINILDINLNKAINSQLGNEVEAILESEYMNGYSEDNTFRPTNRITRAEAVVTLSRIIK